MNTLKSVVVLAFLLACCQESVSAQNGYSSYLGGDCSGPPVSAWRDVDINLVQTRNHSAFFGGPFTTITVTQLRTDYIPGPTVPGYHAEEVIAALQDLSNQGYYTVDLNVYPRGWLIAGRRNRELEQRAAQEQARRDERARSEDVILRPIAQSNRENSNRSSRTCEVTLHTKINDLVYRTQEFINVADEYINVEWDGTSVWEGQSYSISLILEDRSGNRRELQGGQNWVNPGRYRVFLVFSNIIGTSVTLRFRCN